MRKTTCRLMIVITLSLSLGIIYFLVDYFNVPSRLGIRISAFNYEIMGLWINTLVVIGLFVVTFILVDSKNLKKLKNQNNNAKRICLSTFYDCKLCVETLHNNRKLFSMMGVQPGNTILNQLYNAPFNHEDAILSFASDGIIPQVELEHYLSIKRKYLLFVCYAICGVALDNTSTIDTLRMELLELLQHEIEFLERSLLNN